MICARRLLNTAKHVGAPLTLAAAATAAGFLSFLPTDYKGLSELGLLAGLGMIDRLPDQHHAYSGSADGAESPRRACRDGV